MSPTPQRRHGHGVVATAVVALACTLAPSALADPVDQSDIDRSKASERSTSTSIASLEAQLAQESSNLEDAQIKAQLANEDYLTAVDDLNTATTDAQTAQTNADTAASNTESARADLGSIVVQTYQESGNPLDPLAPYLTSESLADLADADVALDRAGEKNNAKVQNVEALQSVATSLQSIADQKVKDKETAKTSAETAKSDAEAAARDAQSAVTTTQTNRQNLISQLATQRNTTVELETKYQNQVEAERKAREEAAAQADGGGEGSGNSAPAPAANPGAGTDPDSAKAIARSMMASHGWGDSEFSCLESLWTRESSWNYQAENASSGAYGIPQALPGTKMSEVADDWATNPTTQITWGLNYISGRYGTPCSAWAHSESVGWY